MRRPMAYNSQVGREGRLSGDGYDTHHPADGTVEQAIFSITCTTCRARLAVRSESAIGAILECPRCESMVQVTPPPGWQPAPAPSETPAGPAGPPPLDHVATSPPVLELELSEPTLFGAFLRPKWLAIGGVALVGFAAVLGLLWLLPSQPAPESVAVETKDLATQGATAPAATEGDAQSSPEVAARPAVTPDPSRDPVEESDAEAESERHEPLSEPESQPVPSEPASSEPAEPSPTQPSHLADIKQPEPDPFEGADVGTVDNRSEDSRTEIKRAAPPLVDVAARLADPVAGIELTDVPLAKAVGLLAAMGNVPVTLDVNALMWRGVAPQDPISLQLTATTLGEALQAIAAQKGLAVTTESGQVLVGAPAEFDQTLRKMRYTVADLTGDDGAAADELAHLVRRLVAPESWQGAGGRGTVGAGQGTLAVTQTDGVHQQVLVFCEKLRLARHKPLRSREDPKRFALTTRCDRARKMLDRPVTANFHEPTPLAHILAFLGRTAGVDILVDHAALALDETCDRVETVLTVERRPLGTVLDELLRPLGLTYRTVGAEAIQVTTPEAAEERLELEFYPVGPWLAKGTAGTVLAERLKARIAPSTWDDVGGLGLVYFDPPSECLLVLQSQPAQAAIERLLESQ